jgi:hypothetical protein
VDGKLGKVELTEGGGRRWLWLRFRRCQHKSDRGSGQKGDESQEGGRGILARWVFSRRGEGIVLRSGGSVMPMQSEEEATEPGAWRGARAGRVWYGVARRRGPAADRARERRRRVTVGRCGSACAAETGMGACGPRCGGRWAIVGRPESIVLFSFNSNF